MCMQRSRMTSGRAKFEIFLIVMRFIRSLFFNLFMLTLGFFLGAGFCMGIVKARNTIHIQKQANISQNTANTDDFSKTNTTRTVTRPEIADGKQNL